MYRPAAFDMDGTLLMPDHRVGPETLAVLNQLVEREMVVTFATGRHYRRAADHGAAGAAGLPDHRQRHASV